MGTPIERVTRMYCPNCKQVDGHTRLSKVETWDGKHWLGCNDCGHAWQVDALLLRQYERYGGNALALRDADLAFAEGV